MLHSKIGNIMAHANQLFDGQGPMQIPVFVSNPTQLGKEYGIGVCSVALLCQSATGSLLPDCSYVTNRPPHFNVEIGSGDYRAASHKSTASLPCSMFRFRKAIASSSCGGSASSCASTCI